MFSYRPVSFQRWIQRVTGLLQRRDLFEHRSSGEMRHTTLHKRIKKLELELEQPEPDRDGGFVVAIDSTGFKITDRGEWLREKHGNEERGWVKAHVAIAWRRVIDVETGELLHEVTTDETIHDNEVLPELIKDLEEIDDRLSNGAYDPHESFQLLQELKSGPGPPGIKTRRNSVVTGNTPRDQAVKERKGLGLRKRWITETFFSSIKRFLAHRSSEAVFEHVPRQRRGNL